MYIVRRGKLFPEYKNYINIRNVIVLSRCFRQFLFFSPGLDRRYFEVIEYPIPACQAPPPKLRRSSKGGSLVGRIGPTRNVE